MKSHKSWTAIVQIIAGLWLWVTPTIFDLGIEYSRVNYIAAPVICCFGIIALSDLNRNAIKLNLLTGVFVIIGTLILSIPNEAFSFNIIASILLILTSLVRRQAKKNYGGGWVSLFRKDPLHLKMAKQKREH